MSRKPENLIGKRFGKLEVVEYAGLTEKGGQRVSQWLCRCDCGNTCLTESYLLKSGRRRSCGCLRISSEKLAGMRFGKLTVLEEDKEQSTTLRKVICRCDCGTTRSYSFRDLKNGKILSCGCDLPAVQRKQDYFQSHYDESQEKKRELFAKGDYGEIYTLNDWLYIWMRDVLPGVVKKNTLVMYGETMDRHILPRLGDLPLKALTSEVVGDWLERLRRESVPGTINETMTEGTVRNTLSVLSGCMRDAQKYGLIRQNPCLEPSWVVSTRNLNEERSWLDDEDLTKLEPFFYQYQSEEGYPMGICYQLILYTGLYMSEATALRWQDVDLEEKTLYVHCFVSVTKAPPRSGSEDLWQLEETVGRKRREVPIPDPFLRRLEEVKRQFEPEQESFVVNPYERTPIRLDRMRAALIRQGKRIGMEKVTPQILRDTYAMRAVHAGASSEVIAELMGFASARQVVRRYMPNKSEDKRELVNRMYE